MAGLNKHPVNVRLVVACLVAASVGLSMALISIFKFVLFITAFVLLVYPGRATGDEKPFKTLSTPVAILVVLAAFAMSLLWTEAPPADAMGSIAKYGKLLVIALMILLIRNRREALVVLAAFAVSQTFLMVSSWMLFAQFSVPWATSNMAITEFAVFSSYLDQGIITAVFAGICWHLRSLVPGRIGPVVAIGVAVASMCNVLFVLSGRSGHVVAIALLSLAIMWQLPKRYRAVVVLLPFVLGASLFLGSAKVRDRLTMMKVEVQSYASAQNQSVSSSGIRLGLWTASAEIIAKSPWVGTGVGSWSTEYNRLQHEKSPAHSNIGGNFNPHQEYLLWAVQLGMMGVLLLFGFILTLWRDTLTMASPVARAVQSTLAGFAVACLFNSSLYDALIGDFFCVTLGLLLALGIRKPIAGATEESLHSAALT